MKSSMLLLFLCLCVSVHAQISTFDSLDLIQSELIYFDFGQADLRPESDSTLKAFAASALEQQDIKIHLTAHTDSIGSLEANMQLSDARASSAKARLVEFGLPDSLLVIQTFGESKPAEENDSDEGRQKNRRVSLDLYKASKYVYLSGQIKNPENEEGIPAKIIIKRKGLRDSIQTDSSGNFKYAVPDKTGVGLEVYAEGFFFESLAFKADAKKMKPLDIELPKVKKGATIDIKNLYFVGDQAALLERSKKELPKVLQFMELNPDIKIEIAGHINLPNKPKVVKESWHFELSVKRAETVYSYLRRNGISSDRLSYKGYGNYQMRYPNARSAKEQELNRRVEIRVLDTGEIIGEIGEDGY